jgi:hypothetical protein
VDGRGHPAVMQSIEIAKPPAGSLGMLQSWIGNRRLLAVAGLAVAGTGLALGWIWLAVVGVAPLIVSVAPCLLMCALGLCMMGRGQQACSSQPTEGASEPPTRTDPPSAP